MSNITINMGTMNGNIIQTDCAGNCGSGKEPENSKERCSQDKELQKYEFDIAVSYSSAETKYVSRVVKILKKEGLRVFFAPDCEEEFMARNMISEFYGIYRYRSMFVAAFVSKSYVEGDITMNEASAAMIREKDEKRNCLIPIYMDDAKLPKLDPDINYIPVNCKNGSLTEIETADKIIRIVKGYVRGREK